MQVKVISKIEQNTHSEFMKTGENTMNIHGLYHEAKSKYAYAYDEQTVHIRLRTAKDDIKSVKALWGDPFNRHRRAEHSKVMEKEYTDLHYDYWFIAISPEYKRMRYAFLLDDTTFMGAHGTMDLKVHPESIHSFGDYYNFPYLNAEDVFSAPTWVKDTVWYQIFPERFANGDASLDLPHTLPWGSQTKVTNEMHFGGDLKGVIEKLDYIKDLGATGIYFTPIFEAPTTHKYDTIDYFKIDPSFGDNATFKLLVQEAHKRGIRVMLDAVFNHCGFKHPYFQDVVKHGYDSEYAQCFHLLSEPVINFPLNEQGFPKLSREFKEGMLNYETFAFTPNMPKWRTGNPVAQAYLLDVATYWIEEYDIDGWRLDVSNEVSHEFWRMFRQHVKAIKPDVFILGENWDDSTSWLRGEQFDSVMNYELTYPIWHLLSNEAEYADYDVQKFQNDVSKLLVMYPKNITPYLFNLLDSHDTSRLKTMLHDDDALVKLAFLMQMSFSGSPSVYYGSEIGLTGVHDGNRQCMTWDESKQNTDLRNHVKQLIHLRSTYDAMKAVDVKWIKASELGVHKVDTQLLAYTKETEQHKLKFILNLSDEPCQIRIPSDCTEDIYENRKVEPSSEHVLPAKGWLILQ